LKHAGFVLEDVVLPQYPYSEVYNLISNAEAGTVFKPLFNDRRIALRYDPVKRADWMAASMMPASDYMTAQRIRAMIRKDADELAPRYAALIAPTSPTGSPLLAQYVQRAADPALRTREDTPGAALTTMSNLAGIPGVSIPCGFDGDGMPLALHIAGRAWSEQAVLEVAMIFQRETDWHRKRPSLRA
jgi:aspartyl-tRNA(Asn)/glutamyl-tRNA(Gln) amidotransferase subunit A